MEAFGICRIKNALQKNNRLLKTYKNSTYFSWFNFGACSFVFGVRSKNNFISLDSIMILSFKQVD